MQHIFDQFNKADFRFVNMNNSNIPKEGLDVVDEHIQGLVALINESPNFMTLYSCEGHEDNSSCYLYFSVNEEGWDLFWAKILPHISYNMNSAEPKPNLATFCLPWKVEVSHKGITLRCELRQVNYLDWEDVKFNFWAGVTQAFKKYLK